MNGPQVLIELHSNRALCTSGEEFKGRLLFETHPELTCKQCHHPGKVGPEHGPSLEGIGNRHTKLELLETVVFPNAKITTGFERVSMTLSNGGIETGILFFENENEVELHRTDGSKVTVSKSQI